MNLLTKEIQQRMPPLYTNENTEGRDQICHVKYFGHWHWFATEACALCLDGDADMEVYVPLPEFKDVITKLNTEYETKSHGMVTVRDVIFFGWVQGLENEWGYFSLSELQNVVLPPFGMGIERDLYIDLPAPMHDIFEYKNA